MSSPPDAAVASACAELIAIRTTNKFAVQGSVSKWYFLLLWLRWLRRQRRDLPGQENYSYQPSLGRGQPMGAVSAAGLIKKWVQI